MTTACLPKEIVQILLRDHEENDVCTKTPIYIDKNVEFLVDTSCLLHWRDVQIDMSGFKRTKTKKNYYNSKLKSFSSDNSEYHDIIFTRFVYSHSSHKDFHKVIVSLTKVGDDSPQQLFYIQYYFDGLEHEVDFTNPRQKLSFSMREKIKELSTKGMRGKQILEELNNKGHDFDSARCATDAAPSLREIYNISKKNRSDNNNDEIIELVDLCNREKNRSDAFLGEVRTAPEFSAMLCNDRQLNDVYRFCAETNASVFGVDPTFNICNNNVTITTYKNPLLIVRSTGKHPVFIGPILIHSKKTFESYYTLPSAMVRIRPDLTKLKAFGTDDEVNLYSALGSLFRDAHHLLCFIHVRDNIEKALKNNNVENPEEYISEIFGEKIGEKKIKGLLDSASEDEFEKKWQQLTHVWLQRNGGKAFTAYMLKNKKEKMKKKMIGLVRQKSGLGFQDFDQNGNESINSMLKKVKGKGILSIKETIKLIQSEVILQEDRLKMALIDRGEWKLAPEAEKLKVSGPDYYRMSSKEKVK